MCVSLLISIIGNSTVYSVLPKEKENIYISNLTVKPDEFIPIPLHARTYIGLEGVSLIQGEENDFIDELISKNIIKYDNCEIHTLPEEGTYNVKQDNKFLFFYHILSII